MVVAVRIARHRSSIHLMDAQRLVRKMLNEFSKTDVQVRDDLLSQAGGVVTLCLTPDSFTAGWASVEILATRILAILGKEFRLPAP